jgi:2-polyprenyl-6-methoxyphenol hydroxylase-like FAD-dependent oxidoreductase
MSDSAVREFDVAIIGYGPVGQALAAMLGQAGHRVGVFERWPTLYPLPRACVVDHEAMRILQSIAVADRFAALAVPTRGEYVWLNAAGHTLYNFRYPPVGDSGWPSRSLMYQPDLEAELDRRVRSLRTVQVCQGFEALAIDECEDGVEFTVGRCSVGADGRLQACGETTRQRARWLVGCDGAGSFVREAAGLPLTDLGFRAEWLVVDFVPHDPSREIHMPEAGQLCDPARPTTLMRHMGHRHVRWEMMLLPGETAADVTRPDKVWSMLERWVRPADGCIERAAVYTFRSGIARRWRAGRRLLAGDAAHLMPPFLGQGLCSGLRDARALFWRLDDVLSGRSGAQLLDSYERERGPHVAAVIERAVALGQIVCITDPAEAARRDAAILGGTAPRVPPFPTLEAGLLHRPGPGSLAGQLAVQPVVAVGGRQGRLDDVVGPGWHLLVDGSAADIPWTPAQADFAASIGLRVVALPSEETAAPDGAGGGRQALEWLRSNGVVAVVARPDFYVFGAAPAWPDVGPLLDDLRRQLRPDADSTT